MHRANKHPAWTAAGVICAPKASRNLTETFSFRCPEYKEHSVCNHLQTCGRNRAAHWSAHCRGKNKCQPPARHWCRHQEAFLSHPATFCLIWDQSYTGTWQSQGQPASLHHLRNTESCTYSPASLLMLQHCQYMLSPDFPSLVPSSGPDSTPRCPVTAWVGTGDLLLSLTFPGWQQNN